MIDVLGISQWASKLDAWSVYDRKMLSELEPFGLRVSFVNRRSVRIERTDVSNAFVRVSSPTAHEVWKQMEDDPRGGSMDPAAYETNLRLCMGLNISSALCQLLLGEVPASQFIGRGFGHRANLAALHKLEPVTGTDPRD